MDIAKILRNILRNRLICLPQDPLLFPGTFRFNLNPESNITDTAALTAALTKVGLWELVTNRGGLDGELDPDSLSHGEQQLLAFARAILRKDMLGGKCLLILDEATSSMDDIAERRVRQLVGREFGGNTVVSVAHRLEALRDVDLALELEGGKVLRLGSLPTA
jgi:ATP-binding cassette, subfamily C (CFTR/MRP), member 1